MTEGKGRGKERFEACKSVVQEGILMFLSRINVSKLKSDDIVGTNLHSMSIIL